MGFLHEIQAAVIDPAADLASVLLKLRLLAAKLGNHPLEEWVRYESEGYPPDIPVPAYRRVGVSYRGTFSDGITTMKNAPIPPLLIAEHANDAWNGRDLRESVAGIAQLAQSTEKGTLYISAANLIVLLQGHVYEGMACHSVTGTISASALTEIISNVRNRILNLTVELERTVPEAGQIGLGVSATPNVSAAAVTQVYNQVFHGDYTAISNTGDGANINVAINKGDSASLVKALAEAGILQSDAEAFAAILASEQPESRDQPFGQKAKAWVGDNIKKALDGTWKIGLGVATGVLTKVALKYYGLDA